MATKKQAPAAQGGTAQAEPKRATYTVGSTPLLLDGDRYEPGDVVELTESQAQGLDVTLAKAEAEAKE